MIRHKSDEMLLCSHHGLLNLLFSPILTFFLLARLFFHSGLIQLRDLLSLSLDIDFLIKAVDSASYHAILQELKDKEIYNVIVDIHRTSNMADFLKAVSDFFMS